MNVQTVDWSTGRYTIAGIGYAVLTVVRRYVYSINLPFDRRDTM